MPETVSENIIIVFTDGGARGNPGPAACGIYLEYPAENLRLICGKYLDLNTNNFAEYQGVILGLEKCLELQPAPHQLNIEFYLDSALVVNQLNGDFKLKAGNLIPLASKIHSLEKNFGRVSYQHVPREKNKQADLAVNMALDKKTNFSQKLN